jgi:hypothetical protein
MNPVSLIAPGVIVVFIGFGLLTYRAQKLRGKQISAALSPTGFNVTELVVGENFLSGISFDEEGAKVCLAAAGKNRVLDRRIISAREIWSAEVFEDGDSVARTVSSSPDAGAAAGALALGGAGLLPGGLLGKQRSPTRAKRVDLRVIINDAKGQTHDVAFMVAETDKDSAIYKRAIERARHWQGILDSLILRSDELSHNPPDLSSRT